MTVFAFRNSTSQQAEAGILETMSAIQTALYEIRKSIDALEPAWQAVEAEFYYRMSRQFNEGAEGIAEVLSMVEGNLRAARENVQRFQSEIGSSLGM